jgi:hypothetical protein
VWVESAEYIVNDVVSYGGNTFICLITHASLVFNTELSDGKWQKFSSGIRYCGLWDSTVQYYKDDVVKSGNSTFIAKVDTVGGIAPFDGNTNYEFLAIGTEGFVSKTGSTMTGTLNLKGEPVGFYEAATKSYVDKFGIKPMGFDTKDIGTLGNIEFSHDGITIYKIDQYGVVSTNTDTFFAKNTPFEIAATAKTVVFYPTSNDSIKYRINGFNVSLSELISTTYTSLNNLNEIFLNYNSVSGLSELAAQTNLSLYRDYIHLCSFMGNDTTGNVHIYRGNRSHYNLDSETRYSFELKNNSYLNGFDISGLTSSSTTYTSIGGGQVLDNEKYRNIASSATHRWMYFTDRDNVLNADNNIAYMVSGVAQYSQFVSGTTYQLADVPLNKYTVTFFAYIGSDYSSIVKITDTTIYNSIAEARNNAITGLTKQFFTNKLLNYNTNKILPLYAVVVNRTGAIRTFADGSFLIDLRGQSLSKSNMSPLIYSNSATGLVNNGFAVTEIQTAIDKLAANNWFIVNAAYTANLYDCMLIDVDNTTTPFTILLPPNPLIGSFVKFRDYKYMFNFVNVTMGRNGKLIKGLAEDLILDAPFLETITLTYINNTIGWEIT